MTYFGDLGPNDVIDISLDDNLVQVKSNNPQNCDLDKLIIVRMKLIKDIEIMTSYERLVSTSIIFKILVHIG